MLNYRNDSNTLIVVLHEIYGINDHIKGVCGSLADLGYDVVCPDLLDGRLPFDYVQEEEAYNYFAKCIGFESASQHINDILREEDKKYKRIFLVGYSIGATIAWICSENPIKCCGMIGYYGSRIRDYMDINPKHPVLLFFPEEEKSFQPKELQRILMEKNDVEVQIFEGKHGFADPFSANYNEVSSYNANQSMKEFLFCRVNLETS